MIVIAGTVKIDPPKRESAKTVMKTMMDATMQEDGCITYQFLFNPWDDSEVYIFEEWESAEALSAHFQTPHMATFREALPNFVTSSFDIKRYEVSEVSNM